MVDVLVEVVVEVVKAKCLVVNVLQNIVKVILNLKEELGTSCGCSRNGTKTKVIAIYRRPNNGKMMLKMINLNKKNKNSTHEMHKKHSVHHKKHSVHHKKHKSHCNGYALRPHGMVHNNSNHYQSKRW